MQIRFPQNNSNANGPESEKLCVKQESGRLVRHTFYQWLIVKQELNVVLLLLDCLAGLVFVLTGVYESLEREEMSDIVKKYGGKVTSSLSRNTTYLGKLFSFLLN